MAVSSSGGVIHALSAAKKSVRHQRARWEGRGAQNSPDKQNKIHKSALHVARVGWGGWGGCGEGGGAVKFKDYAHPARRSCSAGTRARHSHRNLSSLSGLICKPSVMVLTLTTLQQTNALPFEDFCDHTLPLECDVPSSDSLVDDLDSGRSVGHTRLPLSQFLWLSVPPSLSLSFSLSRGLTRADSSPRHTAADASQTSPLFAQIQTTLRCVLRLV